MPASKPRKLMIVGGMISALCSQAQAMTGAELLEASEPFRVGYVWGIINTRTEVADTNAAIFAHQRKCLDATGITAKTAHDQVMRLIRQHPERQREEAPWAVLSFLQAVCGPPPTAP